MLPQKNKKLFLMAAIAIIALNLRPSISGIGPLISEIRLDTGLSNTLLGMLTTLPVLAFGIFSVLTPLFTRRLGTEGTMAFALVILTAGILLRVIPDLFALYLGTLILGIGIALGNVLLPGIVKKKFPKKFGLVTGIYSSMLGIGAAIAAGISVPLSENAGLGWRWSLGAWAILSFIAFLAWFPQLSENIPAVARRNLRSSIKELGKSRIAWMVAIFVGLQSLTFYTIIAWLPEILQERGMNASTAGWMLAMVQGTGVIGTFVFPAWASNRQRQRLPVVILVLIEMVSLAGLMIPTLYLTPLLVSILGFSLGGSFGMALLFIGMRTRGTDSANELSGMAQSVGYTLAATGPALFGGIYDLSQNWLIPLIFLFLIAFAKLATGWRAGYNEFV